MRHKKRQHIAEILADFLGQKKWQSGLRNARLKLCWAEIVGPEIAERAQPVRLSQGRLLVHCDHDVWRTELNYLKPELLKKIAELMGEGVVKEIYLK
jgi:predicted nucleic acid-binding Zn ribbon protein